MPPDESAGTQGGQAQAERSPATEGAGPTAETSAGGGVDPTGAAAAGQADELNAIDYTVSTGDTLWGISQAHLGAGSRWPEIQALNPDTLANPNLIYPGQVLQVPQPAVEGAAEPAGGAGGELDPLAECGPPDYEHRVLLEGESFLESDLTWAQDLYGHTVGRWTLQSQELPVEQHTYTPGVAALVLRWLPDWGTPPTTVNFNGSTTPLDATLAVKAAEESPGFATLPPATQDQLRALLGGETNALSAVARDAFNTLYSDGGWASQPPEAQASLLDGLLTSDDARPELVGPEQTPAVAEYTLSDATVVKDHAFRGVVADAERYTVTVGEHSVPIFAPAAPDAAQGHFHTVEQAAIAIASLPEASRAVLNSVTLNAAQNPEDAFWAVEYDDPDFRSYMTAGAAGDVTIYPTTSETAQDEMSTSMIHETGHTWSKQQWGEDTTSAQWQPWRDAMASDRISLSNYATASLDEDVAETVQAYAANKGTPLHDEYRAMVPARFAILDAHF
ncbi:MAG: LysM peptidoglycan-binding domain-containing protein [Myxococcales bacterium]|nr:LysM peptidoglycan-binding domain-containing protein [Myxococcales bacterium]